MVVYRGWKAVYFGNNRWKVITPYEDGMIFDIKVSGIKALISRIEKWRNIEWA